MNRIIEVNEENAYALVEPGVSYFDLYRYIQERKLKLWVDCPDPGWGSLVGNALDRGSGYTFPSLRNHFDAHCGMEVVLADGELLRTGMGALPNSKTWQQYKTGFGPWIDGLFSQSNFGVVTKMGFWLMPQPEAYRCGRVLVRRRDDLHELIRLITLLENSGITSGCPDSSSPLLGIGSIGAQARFLAVDEPMPTEDPQLLPLRDQAEAGDPSPLEAYGRRNNLAYWTFDLKFYGPAKVIAAQWESAQDILTAIPGAWFEDQGEYRFPLAEEPQDHARYPEFGIPEPQQLLARRAFQHEPNALARTHVAGAHHPAHRRGDLRGQRRLRSSGAPIWHPSAAFRAARLVLAAERDLHLRLSGHRESRREPPSSRRFFSSHRGGRAAWLGGVPHRPGVPGRGGPAVLVQQPFAHALSRNGEGCSRSQRDPLPRPVRDLAETPQEIQLMRLFSARFAGPRRAAHALAAACLTAAAATSPIHADAEQTIGWTRQTVTAPAGTPRGYVEYQNSCTVCHGPMPERPGTRALAAKYKGSLPAMLEQRTDLQPDFIRMTVRNGISLMPPFRKTEVSDEQLDAIVAYLTRPRS